MALALYRKYRPRTFAEVIGQEHVTEPLSQALRSGRLHHAYLFSGPRGCGKTSSARILARSLNCEQGPTPEPCGVCASCRSLMNDGTGSIDVIEIDAASHGGVDDARELREKAFFAPASSRYKIYVIDEAHMVSSAGFNALLKLVEEPPEYVKFIFATTEPEKVLGTIRSRTHHYPFRLIPPAVLRPYLQQLTEAEGVHVDPAVLPLVVRAGGGSARDSLSVLDQLIAGAGPEGVSYPRAVALLGVTDVALIDEMCDALAAGDGAAAYATIDRVAEAGHDPRRFASDLLERFRDLIILQQVPDAITKGLIDGPADQLEAMGAQATRLGPAQLSRSADIVHNGLVEMRGTTAPRLLLELITARMLLPGADDSHGALLQRLERMERRLTLSSEVRPDDTTSSLPDASAGGGVQAVAPGSSGGISAARAAAAAAARRAPAGGLAAGQRPASPEPTPAAASVSPAAVSAPPAAGPAFPEPAAPVSPAPPSGAVAPVSEPEPTGSSVASGGPASPSALADPSAASATPAVSSAAPALAARASTGAVASAAPASASPRPTSAPPARPATAAYDEDEWPEEPPPYDDEPTPASRPVPPQAARTSGGAQPPNRPDPGAILPDAPDDGVEPVSSGAPGQLTAAAVREVWPEIITTVSRQSKKLAALASGATVRDLEGQTVVLTFRFPAHAKMVADQPQLLADALYEALGGRWQIRCEVAGEAGAIPQPGGNPNRGPAQQGPPQQGPPQTGPSRNGPAPREQSAQPTRQRESPPRRSPQPSSDDSDDWPDPARPATPQPAATRPEQPATTGSASPQAPGAPVGAHPRPVGADGSLHAEASVTRAGAQPQAANTPADARSARQSHDGASSARPTHDGAQPNTPDVRAASSAPAGEQPGAASSASTSDDDWPEPARPATPTAQPSATPSTTDADDDGWPETARPGGGAAPAPAPPADEAWPVPARLGGVPTQPPPPDPPRPTTAPATPAAAAPQQPAPPSRSSGLAAARAAAAGPTAGSAATGATSQPSAANRPATQTRPATQARPADQASRPNAAPAAATPDARPTASPGLAAARAAAAAGASRQGAPKTAWSDGSPTEEAPFDPEFDDSAKPFDGFDPGDEPLDEVIDEKSARQNSEQQAMDLLREAFGAEKIGETQG
ncbi:DNA polymerase III subunit gamma and tau [Actinoplanes sp. NPDC089786]|uniref:DNA polymerase III subunit gamma and tau n=1 Tax=Actinoplanes sp. NPDC089786 TaxID=3155185 RepID=UPI003447E781